MPKKLSKRKTQDKIIKSLQSCFQELDVPFKVMNESKETILLGSPLLIGVVRHAGQATANCFENKGSAPAGRLT